MMVVSKSTSSTYNRAAYQNINKMELTQKTLGKNLFDKNQEKKIPEKRVKISDTIEIKEKLLVHTENWLG